MDSAVELILAEVGVAVLGAIGGVLLGALIWCAIERFKRRESK